MSHGPKILDRQCFPAGTVVIEQDTYGSRAYMVESGSVEVYVRNANGSETLLAELGPGSVVGEMAALSDGLRSASVRTKEDSVLIAISAHNLNKSMKASDSLNKRLIHMMSLRMKDTNMKLMKREEELKEAQKASRKHVDDVAAYLLQKQSKLEKELAPVLGSTKVAELFKPGELFKE